MIKAITSNFMKNPTLSPENCATSLKLLGDYWTLRIVDALKDGGSRYCELQRTVDNLNPVTLTTRLKKLEDAGLISRSEELIDKVSVSYKLTDLGTAVLPVLTEIDKFSAKLQNATS